MITAEQALSYQFQKAGMNGYRATEVDEFVTAAAETLNFQEKKIRDMQRIIDELKKNETIIQTTLVNAQKLAMQLTDEAKQSADAVTAEAEQKAADTLAQAQTSADDTVAAAEQKAQQLIQAAEQKTEQMLDDARRDAARQEAELEAQLDRQRKILDALKAEVAAFRSDILNRYKAQVTLIKDLPDSVPVAAVEPVAQPEPTFAVEPIEPTEAELDTDIPVVEVTPIETEIGNDAPAAGNDLLKLMNDMAENEAQAAAAVDEVASLTSEPIAEPDDQVQQLTFDQPDEDQPAPVSLGGFHILIDDDDEDDDGELSFGGRIQVSDNDQ